MEEGVSVLEFVLFLFLFLILGILFFRPNKRRQKGRKIGHFEPNSYRKNADIKPFDADSTQPQDTTFTLEGSAYVIDGDTIVIRKTQIRLFGIDAPELNHPYGNKAKWALVSLCKGQTVMANIIQKDNHDRTVAQCYLPDGRDLSAEMVKLGLAIDWQKFSGGKYRHLELPDIRKKLWLADARQKGRMSVWEDFEAKQKSHFSIK